jgi:hypothetical protein
MVGVPRTASVIMLAALFVLIAAGGSRGHAGAVDFPALLGVEGVRLGAVIGPNDLVVWGGSANRTPWPRRCIATVDIVRGSLRRLQMPSRGALYGATAGDLDADGRAELLGFGYITESALNGSPVGGVMSWDLDRPWQAPSSLALDLEMQVDLVPESPGTVLGSGYKGPISEFEMNPGPRLAIARTVAVPELPSGFVYRCMWRGELDGDGQPEVVLGGYVHVSDGWRALLYICHEDGSAGQHCILPFQCVVQDLGAVGDGPEAALVAAVGYPISHRESLTRGLLKVLRVDRNHAVSIVCDAPPPFDSHLSWASLASLENGEVAVAWVAGSLPSTWPHGMQEYKYTQLCAYRLAGGGLVCTGSRRLEARCGLLGSLPAPANVADQSGPRLLMWAFPPTIDGGKAPPVYSTSPLPFGPWGVYVLARSGPETQPPILVLGPELRGNLR